MFENLSNLLNNLLNADLTFPSLANIVSRVADAFSNPQADPVTTLLASVFLMNILAIVLVIVLYLVIKRKDDSTLKAQRGEFDEALIEIDPANKSLLRKARIESRWFIIMTTLLTFFVLLVGIEVTTTQNVVCISCHKSTVHEKITGSRTAHHNEKCVSCHESGGPIAGMTINFLPRLSHIARGAVATDKASLSPNVAVSGSADTALKVSATASAAVGKSNYGTVNTGACLNCHDDIETGTVTDTVAGIRMQHKEPLQAGTRCLECHTLSSGTGDIVAQGGMNNCLNCHDGKTASTSCTTCHIADDPATASASRISSGGEQLVTNYDRCYSCHDSAPCDSCHGGVRMPHSEAFKTTSLHAYEGTKALWTGSGKCSKCHTATRNSCIGTCHQELPRHAKVDPAFSKDHMTYDGQTAAGINMGCATCHQFLDANGNTPKTVCIGCHQGKGAQ
ncbi:MAG: hypothetical protein JJE36_03205 [Coriobacteriia bacterium]|nr:hypothetical protein [Coriobacteriia bacterium]